MLRPRSAVTVLCIVASAVAQAATLHVPADYETVQAAIDAAEPGDEIVLAPGVYISPATIPAARPGITIRGDGTGEVIRHVEIEVQARDVIIANLNFEYGDYGLAIRPGASCTVRNVVCSYQQTAILVENASATLEGVTCLFSRSDAILVTGADANLEVNGCLAVAATSNGVHAIERATVEVTDMAARYCRCGFRLETGASITMRDCIADYNEWNGLRVLSGSSAFVRDCHLSSNTTGRAAQCNDPGSRMVIEGGTLWNGQRGAFYTAGATGSVTGAEIFDNIYGVSVTGGSVLLTENWIHDNSYLGVGILPWLKSVGIRWGGPVEEIQSDCTMTGNRLENNPYHIVSRGSRLGNAFTLNMDNAFDSSCRLRLDVYWPGGVRVMRGDTPISGAVVVMEPDDEQTDPLLWETDSEGYAPPGLSLEAVETWAEIRQYRVASDGSRTDSNPWRIFAKTPDGALRGRCAHSWDRMLEEQEFDIASPSQIVCVELSAKPVADAGGDQRVEAAAADGAEVTLDASASADEDWDKLIYIWMEGDTVLAGPTSEPAATVHLTPGVHSIRLLVDDGQEDPAEDRCIVTVTPHD